MTCRGAIRIFAMSCGLLVAGWGLTAWGRPGVVRMKNGTVYEGDVTQDPKDPDTLIVNVHGIETRIAKNQIASTRYVGDYAQSFEQRLKLLGPNDVKGRLLLAREAFNNSEYGLAREAAESARQIDPNSADAVAMLNTIQSQIRLVHEKEQQQASGAATQPASAPSSRPAMMGTGNGPAGQNVLSPAQINAIRQAELRPDDRGVRYRFDQDVARRYQRYENIQPSDWAGMTPMQQIQEIIAHGTPEMRRDVEILNDPPALLQYRRNVQPFVLQNCATTGCHAPPNAPAIQFVVPGDSDAATYTNFYILSLYRKPRARKAADAGNPFGPGDLRMIDRQKPEDSLLLQYSLPPSMSQVRHPEVANFRPAVRSTADVRYRTLLRWIGYTLQPVQPDYGFTFTPSGPAMDLGQNAPGAAGASSAPTTQP